MTCPRCGFGENPADARFCENCGGEIGAGQPPAEAQEPPAETVAAEVAAEADDPFDAPTRELPPSPPPARSTGWTCTCGQANPAAEAYCEGCGESRPDAAPSLAPGAAFAGFHIVEATGTRSFLVRREPAADDEPAALLQLGRDDEISEMVATLEVLAPAAGADTLAFNPVPSVLASGTDPVFGAYAVLSQPQGDWQPLVGPTALSTEQASRLLDQLLTVAERAAHAGRALLLAPQQVQVDGDRFLLQHPLAPRLPLDRPLLADPAFLPPEVREGRREIAPWPAGEYCVAATLHSVMGNALGFPQEWHGLIARLLADDPDQRPASPQEVCASLTAAAQAQPVSGHQVAFGTDIGHHHPVNQDAGGVWSWTLDDGTPLTLAVVADGVSAGKHSEVASALTVELMRQGIEAHHADAGLDADTLYNWLYRAGLEAQIQVAAMPFDSYERANATTLVAVCVLGGHAVGMWCGDSRAYGVTPEGCRQLSRDHSWVNLVVDSGRMSLEQAKRDPRAHVIARWLGVSDPPRHDPGFERFDVELATGDRLLVCSDGLYMYFDRPPAGEQELADLIYQHEDDAQAAVDEMIQRALDRGGFDNITAALVGVR
jgi:protein phosphatase